MTDLLTSTTSSEAAMGMPRPKTWAAPCTRRSCCSPSGRWNKIPSGRAAVYVASREAPGLLFGGRRPEESQVT
jgi:hypothetical protein